MIYRLADNIISPLGETTEQNYQAVKAGRSALRHYDLQWDIPEPFTASLFTEAQNEALAIEGLTRFESLAFTSAKKAVEASKIDVSGANVVFILSTTKGNIELIFDNQENTDIYPGAAAKHIAERLGINTNPITVCNACISGVSALVLALRLLEAGLYDYAVVCTQCVTKIAFIRIDGNCSQTSSSNGYRLHLVVKHRSRAMGIDKCQTLLVSLLYDGIQSHFGTVSVLRGRTDMESIIPHGTAFNSPCVANWLS